MARFLKATDDRLSPVWHVACMTGLRRSELCGLQWSDIDLKAGALSVRRARTQLDGRPVVKGPKPASSRRVVDLDNGTIAALRRWKVAQADKRLRAGTAWESGDWCFADQLGRRGVRTR